MFSPPCGGCCSTSSSGDNRAIPQQGAVDEADAGALDHQDGLDKHSKFDDCHLLQFKETVVRLRLFLRLAIGSSTAEDRSGWQDYRDGESCCGHIPVDEGLGDEVTCPLFTKFFFFNVLFSFSERPQLPMSYNATRI